MVDAETLLELERRLLNAEEAVYEDVLAANAVMVFPEPTGILDRTAVLESLGDGDRWRSLDVHDVRLLSVDDDVAQVVYEAVAERSADGSEYRALVTGTSPQAGRRLAARLPPADPGFDLNARSPAATRGEVR